MKPVILNWLQLFSAASFNPLSANFTKWSNTLKQFVGKLPTNCLSVFDHFLELVLKGLIAIIIVYEFFLKIRHQFLSFDNKIFDFFFATISNLQTFSSERTTL